MVLTTDLRMLSNNIHVVSLPSVNKDAHGIVVVCSSKLILSESCTLIKSVINIISVCSFKVCHGYSINEEFSCCKTKWNNHFCGVLIGAR